MDVVESVAEHSFAEHLVSREERAYLYLRRRLLNICTLALGDAFALCIALLGAGVVRVWGFEASLISPWSWYLLPIWVGGALVMRLLPGWGLGPVEELRRLTMLLLVMYASAATELFLSGQASVANQTALLVTLCISVVTVPLVRLRVKRFLILREQWGVPTVVYGGGQTGREIIQFLRKERGLGYNPIGIFDSNPTMARYGDVEVLGPVDMVMPQAPVAILAMPNLSRSRLVALLEGPLSFYRTVLVIPNLFEAPSLWVRPRDLNGILGLEITSNLVNPLGHYFKRATDVGAVLLSAPLWVPLCTVLALLIWIEDWKNPLFSQERVGEKGRLLKTLKFRTMVPNAEEVLQKKLEEDAALRYEWETQYKLKEDPRITRIGKVLRRYSLDELPQLINVLRGDMSLVGPRPLPAYHHEALPGRLRELRERVKPGITGLWQVSGRSDAGMDGMEQWDLYYVRNWSLWLDIVVLTRTFRAVVNGTGAY